MRINTAQPALRQRVSAQTCIQAPCALFPNLDDKFKTQYDSRQQSVNLYTAVPRTTCCCFYVVTAWLRYWYRRVDWCHPIKTTSNHNSLPSWFVLCLVLPPSSSLRLFYLPWFSLFRPLALFSRNFSPRRTFELELFHNSFAVLSVLISKSASWCWWWR